MCNVNKAPYKFLSRSSELGRSFGPQRIIYIWIPDLLAIYSISLSAYITYYCQQLLQSLKRTCTKILQLKFQKEPKGNLLTQSPRKDSCPIVRRELWSRYILETEFHKQNVIKKHILHFNTILSQQAAYMSAVSLGST